MNQDLNEIMESIEKPKISIIMQSYLGDYPGSRTDAVAKFRRAVKSFQNQLYKNCELIIVSDGCAKTHQIYAREFKMDPSIKFILVDKKDTPNMYETNDEGHKYYRGYPRRVGVGAATGELITYMDSDDFLLPEFTFTLLLTYNINTEMKWWINTKWYDNEVANWEDSPQLFSTDHSEDKPLEGLNGKWTVTRVKPGMAVMSPWLLMHKSDCTTKWRDTIGNSEDSDFNRRLRSDHKEGMVFDRPIYVRCHYRDQWDL
jgi:glycosyltransferase involved in cell wall biosynthesis